MSKFYINWDVILTSWWCMFDIIWIIFHQSSSVCSIVPLLHHPSCQILSRGRNFSNFTEDSKRVHLKSPHRRFPRPFRTLGCCEMMMSGNMKYVVFCFLMRYWDTQRLCKKKHRKTWPCFCLEWIVASVVANEDSTWKLCRILTGKRVIDPAQQQANTQFWASPSNLLGMEYKWKVYTLHRRKTHLPNFQVTLFWTFQILILPWYVDEVQRRVFALRLHGVESAEEATVAWESTRHQFLPLNRSCNKQKTP